MERERLERLGLQMSGGLGGPQGNGGGPGDPMGSAEAVNRMQAERIHAERFAMATADHLRLQMAGLQPTELHTHAHMQVSAPARDANKAQTSMAQRQHNAKQRTEVRQ